MDHSDQYMSSAKHTEEAYDSHIWIINVFYEHILPNPKLVKSLYENKDKDALIQIILKLHDKLPSELYDADYRNDWSLQPFIKCLGFCYKEYMGKAWFRNLKV